MPNFEHLAHIFAAMFHVNIAAIGLLLFFYHHVFKRISKNKIQDINAIDNILVTINERFRTTSPPSPTTPIKSIFGGFAAIGNGLVWLFHQLFFYIIALPTFILTKNGLKKFLNEEDYLKRYFPLFFVVGLYCLLMLIFSAILSEFKGKDDAFYIIHNSQIIILSALIFVYSFTIFSMIILAFFTSNKYLLQLNSVVFILSCIAPLIYYKCINESCLRDACQEHEFMFLCLVVLITIYPCFNIFRKSLLYRFTIFLASYYNQDIQEDNTQEMDKNLNL